MILPSDVWFEVLLKVVPSDDLGLKYWLSCRTVSKSFCVHISKMDLSILMGWPDTIEPTWNIPRLLQKFNFSGIKLDQSVLRTWDLQGDWDLLPTRLTSLWVAPSPSQFQKISTILTQLTRLCLLIQPPAADSLYCQITRLTNLRSLSFLDSVPIPHPSCLLTLTRLEDLEFATRFVPLYQAPIIQHLTNLKTIKTKHPGFFESGQGTCKWPCKEYTGEWLDGKRHGKKHGQGTYTWHSMFPQS